ncbi:MAG TPA: dodecin family protein [Candidatus Limnocylindria bacterium]|nr:dodecin family protein [Candidatus Limnocylindria bacterium]
MLDRLLDRKADVADDEMPAGVIKVIEIVGVSERSFDDAIATAVARASASLRHVTGADVKHMTLRVKDGKVAQYRVDLKVAFALDEED